MLYYGFELIDKKHPNGKKRKATGYFNISELVPANVTNGTKIPDNIYFVRGKTSFPNQPNASSGLLIKIFCRVSIRCFVSLSNGRLSG